VKGEMGILPLRGGGCAELRRVPNPKKTIGMVRKRRGVPPYLLGVEDVAWSPENRKTPWNREIKIKKPGRTRGR